MNDHPRTLGGRYELGPVIGRGGMAQVRRATDQRLGRDVAVKELRIDLASDHTFQARFRREAQAAAGLNHHNIVSVYDTGEETDEHTGVQIPYIVMELVEGQTLRDVLREGPPPHPVRALELSQGVLEALGYSHRAGIVHRDIKPANVMLTGSGLVKVMDFGIARAVADTSATMTQTAAVIGTAQYLSPEQARGETVDSRSDIYSAGCLLYELLVGRPPFTGDSPVSVAYQHVREAPVPPSRLNPDVTPEMDAVVLKALAKDPADRYQTAKAMSDDIGRLLAGQPVRAAVAATAAATQVLAPVGPGPDDAAGHGTLTDQTLGGLTTAEQPATPAPRRRRGWAVLVGLLVLALVGTGLFVLYQQNRPAPTVAVPYLWNQLQADAERMITDVGLTPTVERVKGPDDGTVGRVQRQDPQANVPLELGSPVTIWVNVGPDKLQIPSGLVGEPLDEVMDTLGEQFTNVRAVAAEVDPPGSTPDTVLSVDPAEGQSVTADAVITVTYATGRERVPTLLGLTRSEAIEEAERYGFDRAVLRWTSEVSTTATPGTVIGTRPTFGTLVKRTDPIEVILAEAPPEPTPTTEPSPTADPEPTDSATPDPQPTEGD